MRKIWLLCFGLFIFFKGYSDGLRINECMAANAGTIYDEDYYNFSDWIEIYNAGSEQVTLSDYYLSDDQNDLLMWQLPDIKLDSGVYYVVYCDKESGRNHANFGLSADGEDIYLSNADRDVIDKLTFDTQYPDISYGRHPSDNQWIYCITPTPGTANLTDTGSGLAEEVLFSHDAGVIDAPIAVSLNGDAVRYTMDGAQPSSESSNYSNSISVNQTTTIKARANAPGQLPGKTSANTYFYNEHFFTLPFISLTFNPDYFYDDMIGIHVKGSNGSEGLCGSFANWNQDWERLAFLEYFDADGTKRISQNIGVKISGGCTRGRDQKSLSLYARSKYGDNDFDHPFFSQKAHINTFKSVMLRNSGNDQDLTLLRDAFIQNLVQQSMDIDYQSYQPATVYFNGEYRGIMNLREKVDEDYFESNYNIDSDEIDFLEKDREVIRGSVEASNALLQYIEENDLNNEAVWENVESQVDVNEFINYYAAQMYIGNRDWPQNNMKYWKPKGYGKWRWILFDTDYGFGFRMDAPNDKTFERIAEKTDWSSLLFQGLMENTGFKTMYLSRLVTMMHSTFHPEWTNTILDSLAENIDIEIQYNQLKYGRTKAQWYQELEKLRQQVSDRNNFMKTYIQSSFDLDSSVNLTFLNDHPNMGSVSCNGISLRHYPSNIKTYASLPLDIEAVPEKGYAFTHWEQTAHALSQNLVSLGEGWKYMDTAEDYPAQWINATFNDAPWPSGKAQLGYGDGDENTELSYGDDAQNKRPAYLFRKEISIENITDIATIILGFVADDGGIVYINGKEVFRFNMNKGSVAFQDFAAGTVNNENTVIYAELDPSVLQTGNNIIACEVHQASATSSDVSFDLSLELQKRIELNNDIFSTSARLKYANSFNLGLKPVFETINDVQGIYINEIATSSKSFKDDFNENSGYIELYNSNNEDMLLNGFYLSDDNDNYRRYAIPDSTLMPANGFLVFYADGNASQGERHTTFKLSEDGDEVYLSQQAGRQFKVLDSAKAIMLPNNYSYGRYKNGTGHWQYMYQTPSASNKSEIPPQFTGTETIALNVTDIRVYPNPSKGMLHITLNKEGKYFVQLCDMTGKQLMPPLWLNQRNNTMNLSRFGSGLYLLRIQSNDGLGITQKLVIQRP